jgi:two-component system OmpR family sensor kinase
MVDRSPGPHASPPGFRRRLWVKLLLAYLVPVALILTGIGYLAYRAARMAMENQLGDALISVARTAVDLAGKPRALRLAPGDEQTRTYANLKEKLQSLQAAARVESIYLFDNNGRALVDSAGTFAIGEPIMKLAADSAEIKDVFGGAERSSILFADGQGRLYKTGFAPVRLEGHVAAAVGVDGSARFFGPLSSLGRILLLVGAVALVLVVAVTLFVSRLITRPLDRLAQSARRIGRGDLDREIEVETTDEIGMLARTLNEMRKSIQERDRQLQMMLSGIAHEVRNPLGGMALFAGLLKEELGDHPTGLKHLDKISMELDYLSRVVNDFLDFARERPLELEEMDPRAEFEQVEHLSASELQQAGVRLKSEVTPGVKQVQWDRERMRRVLLNLVRNAIQASKTGGAVVIRLEKDGSHLLLSVSDEGCGIPDGKRAQVFEPFYTSRQQGTGLGLALVKKIVEAHGGSISFITREEQGTTFTLRLPASPGA